MHGLVDMCFKMFESFVSFCARVLRQNCQMFCTCSILTLFQAKFDRLISFIEKSYQSCQKHMKEIIHRVGTEKVSSLDKFIYTAHFK